MKDYIVRDPWKIIEEGFNPEYNRFSESLCSIGNGHMGMRGNFEETYTGDTLQGSYMAGVYYPDKTIVGWWKNGYPDYFAKVLNAPNWAGLSIKLDGEEVDIARGKLELFRRELDMKSGILSRTFRLRLKDSLIEVSSSRFVSMARPEIGVLRYSVKLLEGSCDLTLKSFIDGNVRNEDANYNEFFWEHLGEYADKSGAGIAVKTKKTDFSLAARISTKVYKKDKNNDRDDIPCSSLEKIPGRAAQGFKYSISEGETIEIIKIASCLTDRDHPADEIVGRGEQVLNDAVETGYSKLEDEHRAAWSLLWEHSDITIEGDAAAQQGIRFNIFHLNQTYTGKDERLNIGPKGFTGEKYGGASYWDTEAYCLPFYLSTAESNIARQLLLYRYNHLQKAIENAEKLGFSDGAALYPMVTMNGEECHNEWEITFEEIHRNGAIAYAIFDYINTTGDKEYLLPCGLEVLTAIARFWVQRVNWSEAKQQYVMLGVTGPNEYENNVHNNWYTNYLAAWCLRYTAEVAEQLEADRSSDYRITAKKINLTEAERKNFLEVAGKLYLPEDSSRGIFVQQDGFLDKNIKPVDSLGQKDRPLNQNWSWDRILRSCYIKQADVLQGFYFFEDDFDTDTLRRNYDFYEPITVHESSLSPCIHSILALSLGYTEKAYELYLRTARLDLDDYNNDTEDGCHITSMAGTWMSVVMGFGGLRHRNGDLFLNPSLPSGWKGFSFMLMNRGVPIKVLVTECSITVENHGEEDITFKHGTKENHEEILLSAGEKISRAI